MQQKHLAKIRKTLKTNKLSLNLTKVLLLFNPTDGINNISWTRNYDLQNEFVLFKLPTLNYMLS